jgi:probable F420-dependent oxidoreductase
MNVAAEPTPDVIARALEDRGFESIWCGEHSHIPVSRRTPYPAGGELPDLYLRMGDPFVALTAAALSTTTLKLGTAVLLVLQRDPFYLAKATATLDLISGGRLLVGVGVGWNVEELENHSSIPWGQRYRAMTEAVEALRALWTEDEASFHGTYFDFDPVYSFPKPVQRPHPPILCGTAGRVGTKYAVQWADGWMPIDAGGADMGRKLERFRQTAADAGRDPATIEITVHVFGDPTQGELERYREVGVDRVVLGPARRTWSDPTSVLPFLDDYAPIVAALA